MNQCEFEKMVPIGELKTHPKNRNDHPDEQIARLARVIEYQGFRHPIIVSNLSGFIVAGHGRLAAARKLGLKEVPVDYQDFESEEQEYAFLVSDNAIALWAELDLSGINADIGDLGPDFDIDLLGIKNFTIEVADKEGLTDPDEIPEHVEPRTKPGDIYRLGNHRLMCGDSTDISAVEQLMGGERASFVFTSPPYNGNTSVGFAGSGLENATLYKDNTTDAKSSEEYLQFNRDIFATIAAIGTGDVTVCYNVNYNKNSPSEFIDIVSDAKQIFPLRETVAWEKSMAISLAGSNLTRIFEFIFIFSAAPLKMNKGHNECVKNLWKISNTGANTESHKACFPVELPKFGMDLLAQPGANVFEPFGGSGTTMIAAEMTGRKAFLMELDPHYCDVIVARWEKFTGQKAQLMRSGNDG